MSGINNFVMTGGIALGLIAIALVLASFLWDDRFRRPDA